MSQTDPISGLVTSGYYTLYLRGPFWHVWFQKCWTGPHHVIRKSKGDWNTGFTRALWVRRLLFTTDIGSPKKDNTDFTPEITLNLILFSCEPFCVTPDDTAASCKVRTMVSVADPRRGKGACPPGWRPGNWPVQWDDGHDHNTLNIMHYRTWLFLERFCFQTGLPLLFLRCACRLQQQVL